MGRGRDAGSGVLTWCTHRLEVKADQTQYDRWGDSWGVAKLLCLPFFLCCVKVHQAPPYGIKKSLKRGEFSKFRIFSMML